MEFGSHFGEYIFLVLKIVGIVGAFAGFSAEEKPAKHGSRRSKLIACTFLLIAVSAEICDSSLKISEAKEQTLRFERLAHPVGSIYMTTNYSINLPGDLLKEYGAAADKDGLHFSDPKSQPNVFALLTHTVDMTVFFFKKGSHAKKGEPDMTLFFPAPFAVYGTEAGARLSDAQLADFKGRNFFYYNGALHTSLQKTHDDAQNRYSNGEIISMHDLLDTRVEIQFCPSVTVPGNDSTAKSLQLEQLIEFEEAYIKFPGSQEIRIAANDKEHVSLRPAELGNVCPRFIYTIPKDQKEFNDSLIP